MAKEYLNLENARLIFKPNFRGEKDQFNKEGARSFNVVLEDPGLINRLVADGWNVKKYTPASDPDIEVYFLNVAVSYAVAPPNIYMVLGDVITELGEETVGELDNMDISTIDLQINPYHWEVNGKSGVKAYAKTAYVNVVADPFLQKYRGGVIHLPLSDIQ